jgi:hypothetical protein
MAPMADHRLTRLEAGIEHIIEGAFAQIFGKSVQPHDLALALARAMETSAMPSVSPLEPPTAPNSFVIHLCPDEHARLMQSAPDLENRFGNHLVHLAGDMGLRMPRRPQVHMIADTALARGEVQVHAGHVVQKKTDTSLLEPVHNPTVPAAPSAVLYLDSGTDFALSEAFVGIGRARDNHLVLDDQYVSRHHAQIRLRFGRYTLFDLGSQAGTFVNEHRIREHLLQSGDVLRLGKTRIVYMDDIEHDATAALTPLDE